jgi:hypothetical protein
VEGENSTSGPQPYQPYEAEVTNSPISNNRAIYVDVRPSIAPSNWQARYYDDFMDSDDANSKNITMLVRIDFFMQRSEKET